MSERNGLPEGWTRTTLGETFKWGSGGTPQSHNTTYYDGDIPWLIIGDLQDGVIMETQRTITQAGLENSSAKWVSPGSILVAMYGSIGKLGIVGVELTTNQAIAFTDPQPVEAKYLFYYLLHHRTDLAKQGKGGTQQNISQTVIKSFPFVLAPLPEQRRIVSAIEEQLAAFEKKGKNPPKNWRAKYEEPAAPDTQDLPELPEGWCWATVNQLNPTDRPCAYGVLQPGPDVPGGVPLVRVGDVNDGHVNVEALKCVSPAIAERYPRTRLRGGEVLITLVGTIGRTAVVERALEGANTARAVSVVPLDGNILTSWVEIWFRSPDKRREMITQAHEVARKTLNLKDVRAATVALPPRVEQEEIVAEVERRLSVLREVEAEVEASLKRAARLRQAVLKRAFEGRLVPQDPSDEPASELLARIRAKRERDVSPKRRKRREPAREGERGGSQPSLFPGAGG